jgi:hypothetical protein
MLSSSRLVFCCFSTGNLLVESLLARLASKLASLAKQKAGQVASGVL